MKTKLQVALEALEKISMKIIHYQIDAEQGDLDAEDPNDVLEGIYRIIALAELKAMPEENCGNCKHIDSFRVIGGTRDFFRCDLVKTCFEDHKTIDFCSRFEPKEKAE